MGFATKKDIVKKLTEIPRPVSDRIMTMRLPLSMDNFATIISMYAPTMTNPDSVLAQWQENESSTPDEEWTGSTPTTRSYRLL